MINSEVLCNIWEDFNPLRGKFIKWSNILKQIVGKLPTICLSVFDHFSGLALKGLRFFNNYLPYTGDLNSPKFKIFTNIH